MTRTTTPDHWQASWAQALSDVRDESEPVTDVTLRTRLRLGIGGDRLRLEVGNRFGDDPLVVGRIAATVDGRTVAVTVDGRSGTTVPPGRTAWSDPVALPAGHGATLTVDVQLPAVTRFPPLFAATGDVTCLMSGPGDHVGATRFPAVAAPPFPMPDDVDIPAATGCASTRGPATVPTAGPGSTVSMTTCWTPPASPTSWWPSAPTTSVCPARTSRSTSCPPPRS